MQTIAEGTVLADLEYLGRPGHIATCFLETGEGLAVVDPGPATTLDRFQDTVRALGATLQDVRILLITHIHLDHAGATGWLAEALPKLRVYVHERGAPHLVDPSKLLRSATMIYGEDRMLELWGEVKPVPAARVQALAGGERLHLGGRTVTCAWTPGHAVHHLAWFDERSGIAFTGDVLGEHVRGTEVAIPVTPPPDIDVEQMIASGERVMAWQPAQLFLTHFGPVTNPAPFVTGHATRLVEWSERVRRSLEEPGSDEDRARRCAELSRRDLEAVLPESARDAVDGEALYGNWFGLARYWRKKAG